MKHNLYAVKDIKAGTFGLPVKSQNAVTSMREVITAAKTEGSALNQFPQDFQLFRVSEYDDETGTFNGEPEFIIDVISLIQKDVKNG